MRNQKNRDLKKITKSKYFYPILVALGFSILTLALLYVGSAPSLSQLKEGDVSLRTIYATYDFTYPTKIDEEKTEEARSELRGNVPPLYDIDASIQDQAFKKLDGFFDNLKEVKNRVDLSGKEKVGALEKKSDFLLNTKALSKFLEFGDSDKIRKIAKDALENVYLVGVLKETDKKLLLHDKVERVLIRNERFEIEREAKTKNLVDHREADKIVSDTLARLTIGQKSVRKPVYELIKNEIKVNTFLNKQETDKRKELAASQVLPVYNRRAVKKNELIVEKGKRFTKDDIAKLTQVTRIHAVVNRTSYLTGLFTLLMGLVLIVGIYLVIFEKKLINTPRNAILISINAFLAILASLVIIQSQLPGYLIPLASISMILVLLLNLNIAFITTLALSIYIGFMAGGKLSLTFMLFMGSALGIYVVRGAKKRSQIFMAGFAVAVMNFLCIAGTGFLNNVGKQIILREGLYGLANGLVSAFIVIGLLPVFEYAFSLITNVTLLELSDLSNPLLKELTIKAPGTYHHSILVGNLAEEACNSIGANSLLARVGSYYHDIGKVEKAEYFVENEGNTKSKHDKLTPSMSALIITNHTKDGVELARKYKLNKAIIDFVSQHHGTSLIYYFYQKALEKVKSEDELKEEEFRYPGPRPQTKETAIVHLADSVEASSRMLSDPTPSRIRGLVQKIINNKFIDGQLDECELTLKDLNQISESFVRVLTGVFHTRLEYPDAKVKKEKKNGTKNKNK